MNILYSSIGLISCTTFGLILIALNNRYYSGLIKYISDNIILHTKSRIVRAYLYTWFIMLTYNLYSSLLHLPNIIIVDDNIFYAACFMLGHFAMLFLIALIEVGPRKVLSSMYNPYPGLGTGIKIVMLIINLLTNFFIKPISSMLRIIINVYMGEILHSIFSKIAYGNVLLEVMSVAKCGMYIIQIYIIMLLSNLFYNYLTGEEH